MWILEESRSFVEVIGTSVPCYLDLLFDKKIRDTTRCTAFAVSSHQIVDFHEVFYFIHSLVGWLLVGNCC